MKQITTLIYVGIDGGNYVGHGANIVLYEPQLCMLKLKLHITETKLYV